MSAAKSSGKESSIMRSMTKSTAGNASTQSPSPRLPLPDGLCFRTKQEVLFASETSGFRNWREVDEFKKHLAKQFQVKVSSIAVEEF
jgi:uncharacterized phage protein gp47/JayE